MFVDEAGTGRSTFEVDGFSRSVLVVPSFDVMCIELERRCAAVRLERPRDGGGGASPKMKNLMNAPINRTTDSCPSKKPCVNVSLDQSVSRHTPLRRESCIIKTHDDCAATGTASAITVSHEGPAIVPLPSGLFADIPCWATIFSFSAVHRASSRSHCYYHAVVG